MLKKIVISMLFFVPSCFLFSQAGYGVYQFIDLPVSSRQAALGGSNVSMRDNDLSFAFQNPSLLTDNTSKMISLNMANYLTDIKFGSAMYGFSLGKKNYFAVGVQYIDYGSFVKTSDVNVVEGEFGAQDMALNIVYSRSITDRINVGATLKPIFSVFESYSSFGVALDAGISYVHPNDLFSAGFVVRNLGTQITGYYSDENGQHYEPIPLNIQLGLSQKLEHAPFRMSLTLHNLQRWNLAYSSLNQSTNTGSLEINSPDQILDDENEIGFLDMAFRHSIIGVEFLPGKNFYLAASYHHRRHQELKMTGFKSLTGFSFGGGLKLRKFQLGFGMSQFQLGNYSYQFSINTSLNEFGL
jgi:hypothetical protein